MLQANSRHEYRRAVFELRRRRTPNGAQVSVEHPRTEPRLSKAGLLGKIYIIASLESPRISREKE